METTPLVVNGTMYLTGYSNHAWVIDLRGSLALWHYHEDSPRGLQLCCGEGNRGFAALGDRLFKELIVAIDPATGEVKWRYKSAEGMLATAGSLAFTGDSQGYGFALDACTGKILWHY